MDNYKSKIIEKDNEYIIDDVPYKILEYSCEYFGSSLEGRLSGAKNMLGYIYKTPVMVEESRNIIFFPSNSPKLAKTFWVSVNNIINCRKLNEKQTEIIFINNQKITVDIPFPSIENQILRSTRLCSVYNRRKTLKKSDNF